MPHDERDGGEVLPPPSDSLWSRSIRFFGDDRVVGAGASALFLGLLLLYTIVAPAFRGPDEPHHFDLVREWSVDWDYPVLDRQISNQVYGTLDLVEFFDRSQHLEQGEAPPRSARPGFEAIGPDVDSTQYNQISQHPPLYYALLGTVDWTIDAIEPGPRWAFDRELAIIRLLTVALLAPVPWLIYSASRQLDLTPTAAFAAALLPSTIPQLTHIGSTVNNDNLVVLLSALLLRSAVRAFDDDRAMLAALTGSIAGAMLLTKGFGIIAPPLVAVGFLVAWRRGNTTLVRAVKNTAIAAGVTLVVSGWWYVRNIIVYGTPQPARAQLAPAAAGFEPDAAYWWRNFKFFVPNRFFGDFGWFDVQISRGWVQLGLAVLVIGTIFGILAPRARKLSRPVALSFLMPFGILFGYLLIGTWNGYVTTSQLPGMQGRYLFPALPFLAPVIASGWDRILGRGRSALPLLTIVFGGLLQWQGLRSMLGFYWAPVGASTRDQVAAMVSWAPWPPAVFVLIVLVALGSIGVVTIGSLTMLRSTEPASVGSA